MTIDKYPMLYAPLAMRHAQMTNIELQAIDPSPVQM